MMKRLIIILMFGFIPFIHPALSFQPGGGPPGRGGGGGGPGGGQGNDPCGGANPPPNCVPIQGIEYLIFVGSLFGIFVIYKKNKKGKKLSEFKFGNASSC